LRLEYRTFDDFADLEDRPLKKGGRTVSLILPARHEHATIGNYFPAFARLAELGCFDEIIIADSSDDNKTIDTALEAAMNTPPFSEDIYQALRKDEPLPVKVVNVFDPRFSGIFNGHKPERGTVPGKGTAMYLGMAVASGDILLFLDSDFQNIHPGFVYGLAGPFEDQRTVLSKATFDVEDLYDGVVDECMKKGEDVGSCDLLLKSVNARTIAKPMMRILDQELELSPGISGFNGPLSGGCGAHAEIWRSLVIPMHYGVEVSYLMQFVDMFPNGHCAYDVNLGEVIQRSQDDEGRVRMAQNIISTIVQHLMVHEPQLYDNFVADPACLTDMYIKHAEGLVTHNSDADRINLYSDIIRQSLTEDTRQTAPTLLPLDRNVYYRGMKDELISRADKATAERMDYLTSKNSGSVLVKSEQPDFPITPELVALRS